MKLRGSLKIFCALFVLGIVFFGVRPAAGLQTKASRQLTINNAVFTVPKGYERLPAGTSGNAVFLYNRQTKEGMVVAVPASPFAEAEVLKGLIKDSQQRFFPKESEAYQWKSVNLLQKVSKFEVNGSLEKGLNRNHLWVFEYRHVVFNQRDVIVGTIFEARRGKAAAEMFQSEGAAMSMTSCSAAAELIYSFTGEKIDPEKPPCELVANVPE
jgi:hypothetical protein